MFTTNEKAATGVKVPVHDAPVPVDVGGLIEVASVEVGREVVELEAVVLLEYFVCA
jgi:hypothetical protein